MLLLPFVNAQSGYHETIAVLKQSYEDESRVSSTYMAYAQMAKSEGYPNIAKLLVALATSESIHARNFKRVLFEMGVEVKEQPKPELKVTSTKENLKRAADAEMAEIDTKYPQFLRRIKPACHAPGIQNIIYAWESEKQHRDLIKKIQSGTGMFFEVLVKKIEESPTEYFVCQNCGSTRKELPKDTCPICGRLASGYKRIE
jgi:rubrerythrin